MFFDVEILCNRSGKFFLVWDVSTRGIAALTNTQIRQVNVSQACDDLSIYIRTASSNVQDRLSLRLSAQLVSGIVRIHRKQVELFYNKVIAAYMKRRTVTPTIRENGSDLTPIVKIRGVRRKEPVQIPNQDWPQYEAVVEAVVDEPHHAPITMVETEPIRSIVLPEVDASGPVDDEFGIGHLVRDENDPNSMAFPDFSDFLMEKQPPILENIQELSMLGMQEAVPNIEVLADIIVHRPMGDIIPQHIEQVPQIELNVAPSPTFIRPRITTRVQKKDKFHFKLQDRRKPRSINTVNSTENMFIFQTTFQPIFGNEINQIIHAGDVMMQIIVDPMRDEQDDKSLSVAAITEARLPRTPSLQQLEVQGQTSNLQVGSALQSKKTSGRLSPFPFISSTPLIAPSERPGQVLHRRTSMVEEILQLTTEEGVGVCRNGAEIPPLVHEVASLVHEDVEQIEIERQARAPRHTKQTDNVANINLDNIKIKRQRALKRAIAAMSESGKVEILLDDVAPKPLNKFNAAACFGDLLHICHLRLVDLIPDEFEAFHHILVRKELFSSLHY